MNFVVEISAMQAPSPSVYSAAQEAFVKELRCHDGRRWHSRRKRTVVSIQKFDVPQTLEDTLGMEASAVGCMATTKWLKSRI